MTHNHSPSEIDEWATTSTPGDGLCVSPSERSDKAQADLTENTARGETACDELTLHLSARKMYESVL